MPRKKPGKDIDLEVTEGEEMTTQQVERLIEILAAMLIREFEAGKNSSEKHNRPFSDCH